MFGKRVDIRQTQPCGSRGGPLLPRLSVRTHAHMEHANRDLGWSIPDDLWNEMEPLLPPPKPHPLGCHNPRVDDRKAMDAIFFVLRTGCQWGALDATGICKHSSAHRRFQEWRAAGVFEEFWRQGLLSY